MTTAQSPLVLASASTGRDGPLRKAGIAFDVIPPAIDGCDLCTALAGTKAQSVIEHASARPAIGADQVLVVGDAMFNKPIDRAHASDQPQSLRRRVHTMISERCALQAGELAWHSGETARLQMCRFSDMLMEIYLDRIGNAALTGLRVYQERGLEVLLFNIIKGCHTTIPSLPLLPLLEAQHSRAAAPA